MKFFNRKKKLNLNEDAKANKILNNGKVLKENFEEEHPDFYDAIWDAAEILDNIQDELNDDYDFTADNLEYLGNKIIENGEVFIDVANKLRGELSECNELNESIKTLEPIMTDESISAVTSVPLAIASAYEDSKRTDEHMEADMKEKEKVVREFLKDSQVIKRDDEYSIKLELNESLFSEKKISLIETPEKLEGFKAFITNLGKYNEGELVGKWVEFPIEKTEFDKILSSIGVSDKPDAEGNVYDEWFVTDYESPIGDAYDELGEYPSFDALNSYGELIDEAISTPGVEDVIEATGCSMKEAVDGLNNGSYYFYEDVNNEAELGEYIIDEYGGTIDPDLASRYFDYEALGRDLSFDSYEDDDGEYISAGEYWCNDENASDADIGEAYVDEVGMDGVANIDYYFDYEAYGRDLLMDRFTLTSNGAVEDAS